MWRPALKALTCMGLHDSPVHNYHDSECRPARACPCAGSQRHRSLQAQGALLVSIHALGLPVSCCYCCCCSALHAALWVSASRSGQGLQDVAQRCHISMQSVMLPHQRPWYVCPNQDRDSRLLRSAATSAPENLAFCSPSLKKAKVGCRQRTITITRQTF